MPLTIESSAFQPGGAIPRKHTCEGNDVSPPLAWRGEPGNTKSFALIVDDPDALVGTWVHWVLAGIPPSQEGLSEGIDTAPRPKAIAGAVNGKNDFGKIGYGGPAPPRGPAHRYYFKLYALDKVLELPPGATKAQLEAAMKGHILGQAELMGRYQRR